MINKARVKNIHIPPSYSRTTIRRLKKSIRSSKTEMADFSLYITGKPKN